LSEEEKTHFEKNPNADGHLTRVKGEEQERKREVSYVLQGRFKESDERLDREAGIHSPEKTNAKKKGKLELKKNNVRELGHEETT